MSVGVALEDPVDDHGVQEDLRPAAPAAATERAGSGPGCRCSPTPGGSSPGSSRCAAAAPCRGRWPRTRPVEVRMSWAGRRQRARTEMRNVRLPRARACGCSSATAQSRSSNRRLSPAGAGRRARRRRRLIQVLTASSASRPSRGSSMARASVYPVPLMTFWRAMPCSSIQRHPARRVDQRRVHVRPRVADLRTAVTGHRAAASRR